MRAKPQAGQGGAGAGGGAALPRYRKQNLRIHQKASGDKKFRVLDTTYSKGSGDVAGFLVIRGNTLLFVNAG